MCLGMNSDVVAPGRRSASTSNRNFQGRQGPGARTHLVSPAVAAATAVSGRLTAPPTWTSSTPRPGSRRTAEHAGRSARSVAGAQLDGERLRESEETPIVRGVGDPVRVAEAPGQGRHRDDAARPGLHERRPARWVTRNVPWRLTRTTAAKASGSYSLTGAVGPAMPASLTSTSRPPRVRRTSSNNRSRASASPTFGDRATQVSRARRWPTRAQTRRRPRCAPQPRSATNARATAS